MTATTLTIAVKRPVPCLPGGKMRPGWAREARVKIRTGCYETGGGPVAREVYVREQVGTVEGWSYCEWDGTTPTAVKLYVRVTI